MSKQDKLTILVVDDDVFYLKSIIIGLDGKYHDKVNFKYFFNPIDLLNQLKANEFQVDLILLDYNLDNSISGIELIQRIKAINPQFDIVMVSSQQNLQTVFSTIKSGARTYIQKGSNILKDLQDCVDNKIASKEDERLAKKTKKIAIFAIPILVVILFTLYLLKK
ncbi:MAG: response regulator [Bacteroidetes bacterium]|nr:response regulator [Bacteroidota bacterium]